MWCCMLNSGAAARIWRPRLRVVTKVQHFLEDAAPRARAPEDTLFLLECLKNCRFCCSKLGRADIGSGRAECQADGRTHRSDAKGRARVYNEKGFKRSRMFPRIYSNASYSVVFMDKQSNGRPPSCQMRLLVVVAHPLCRGHVLGPTLYNSQTG